MGRYTFAFDRVQYFYDSLLFVIDGPLAYENLWFMYNNLNEYGGIPEGAD